MLDRRQEIHNALLQIKNFTWPTSEGVYRTIVRFNRSFDVLQNQVRNEPTKSSVRSIYKLHDMIGSVGHGRIPWAFHDAGRPMFWDRIVELATEALQETLQFPEPSFEVDTSCFDLAVTYVGSELPSNPSPEEHCSEDDEDDENLGSIHFRRWWEFRGRAVDTLRNFGYTAPEDVVGVDRLSFYVTEDELDEEQNVFVSVGPRFSLCVNLLAALSASMSKYEGWVAALSCSGDCTICVGAKGNHLVGSAFKSCRTLDDALRVAQTKTDEQ